LQQSNENEQVAADRLGRSIKVARVGGSDEIAISARAKDPGLAAQIANAVATSVVEKATKEGNAADAQQIDDLREERDRIQNALQADYAEQDALNKELRKAAVGAAALDLIDDQIAKTREELVKAQADHDQAEARFTSMKVGEGNSSAAISAEADDLVAADPGMTGMKTTLNQRRAVLITQMANVTPDNPVYRQDAEELATLNGALDSVTNELRAKAANHIEEKLRTELERTADVEAKLNGRLHQLAQTAASATPKLQRLNDLAADIARMRDRYSTVDKKVNFILLEEMAAVPPLHPTISGILERAMWLVLGGLIVGVVVAVVVHRIGARVNIAADVERVLGMAPPAVLPDFEEVSDGEHNLLHLSAAIEQVREGAERVAEDAAPERAHRGLLMNASDWSKVTPALASLRHRTARSKPDPLWRPEAPVTAVTEASRPVEGSDFAQPAASSPIARAEPLPDWFWAARSSGPSGSAESGTVEKEKPVEGENPFEAESRLSGLRGLVLTLELKKLNMRRESARLNEEPSSAESASEPSPLTRRGSTIVDGEAATAEAAAPEANVAASEVTAEPEFLRPKEFVPMSETKRAQEESDDDIRILPARRGQYRSKG
jgi:capsular polysaccharide biosynthesis protein